MLAKASLQSRLQIHKYYSLTIKFHNVLAQSTLCTRKNEPCALKSTDLFQGPVQVNQSEPISGSTSALPTVPQKQRCEATQWNKMPFHNEFSTHTKSDRDPTLQFQSFLVFNMFFVLNIFYNIDNIKTDTAFDITFSSWLWNLIYITTRLWIILFGDLKIFKIYW